MIIKLIIFWRQHETYFEKTLCLLFIKLIKKLTGVITFYTKKVFQMFKKKEKKTTSHLSKIYWEVLLK